jgi:hypothetical protein
VLPLCLPAEADRSITAQTFCCAKHSESAPYNGGTRLYLLEFLWIKLLAGEGQTCLVADFHNRRLSVSGDTHGHFLFIAFGCLIYVFMLVPKQQFVKQNQKFCYLAQSKAEIKAII